MQKRKILFLFSLFVTLICCAQEKDFTPELKFIMRLDVKIAQPYTIGDTPAGKRTIIPITGGTFEGPSIKGEILPGGADYQMISHDGERTTLEAIYSIRTDDGIYIHIRNRGIISTIIDENGEASYYFKTTPQFEAPSDSKYSWINNGIFICQPEWGEGEGIISLNVWLVK